MKHWKTFWRSPEIEKGYTIQKGKKYFRIFSKSEFEKKNASIFILLTLAKSLKTYSRNVVTKGTWLGVFFRKCGRSKFCIFSRYTHKNNEEQSGKRGSAFVPKPKTKFEEVTTTTHLKYLRNTQTQCLFWQFCDHRPILGICSGTRALHSTGKWVFWNGTIRHTDIATLWLNRPRDPIL